MSELLKNSNGVASSSRSDFVLQEVHVCDICSGPGREDSLAICSRCSDGAEHIYCMRERMYEVPSRDWVCEECRIGIQTEGRKTVDIEAMAKMNSFGQANSGSNGRKKKSRAKVSDRVGKGSTPKILGKRQSEGVEVQDMQGDRGISAELTSLSSGGRVPHLEETRPHKSQRKSIPDLNSPPDDITFSDERLILPVAEEEVRRSDETSAPIANRSDVAGGDFTFTVPVVAGGDITFSVPVTEEEVRRSDETSAPIADRSDVAGGDFTFTVPVVAGGDITFSVPVAEEVRRSDETSAPNANRSGVAGGGFTFSVPVAEEEEKRHYVASGDITFSVPVAEEEVRKSDETSAPNANRSGVAGGDFTFSVPVAEEEVKRHYVAGGDITYSAPVAEEEAKRGDGSSAPNVVGADLTFCGERLFLPVSDEEVKRRGESSGLNLNLEPEEEAAATMGGEDEISLSLSLFPDAGTTR